MTKKSINPEYLYDGQRPSASVERIALPKLTEDPPLEPGPGQRSSFADLPLIIKGRRSVRNFTQQEVSPALIQALIEAAHWAPSPHGRQPWRFVILTKDGSKRKLAEAMSNSWSYNLSLDADPPEIAAKRLTKSRERLLNSPVLILVCLYLTELDQYPDRQRQEAEKIMAIQSLGAAVQNILLTAYNLGLDTGWMCAPLFCPEIVQDCLALETDLIPQVLLNVGYAAQAPRRRARRSAAELIALYD